MGWNTQFNICLKNHWENTLYVFTCTFYTRQDTPVKHFICSMLRRYSICDIIKLHIFLARSFTRNYVDALLCLWNVVSQQCKFHEFSFLCSISVPFRKFIYTSSCAPWPCVYVLCMCANNNIWKSKALQQNFLGIFVCMRKFVLYLYTLYNSQRSRNEIPRIVRSLFSEDLYFGPLREHQSSYAIMFVHNASWNYNILRNWLPNL